jgi:hypothetical protein
LKGEFNIPSHPISNDEIIYFVPCDFLHKDRFIKVTPAYFTTNDKSIANRIIDLKYSLRSKEIFVDIRIWIVQVQKFIIQIKV